MSDCTCAEGGHPLLCSDQEHVELWKQYTEKMSKHGSGND